MPQEKQNSKPQNPGKSPQTKKQDNRKAPQSAPRKK